MPKPTMDKNGGCIVSFSVPEVAHYRRLAELRHNPKRAAGIKRDFVTKQDGVENDFIGILGEAAVGAFLGIGFDETISLAGDGGVKDLELDGTTIQVKTMYSHGSRLMFNDKADFLADVAVLVRRLDDRRAEILGWIPRQEFLIICGQEDFGYGMRHFVPEKELYPIRQLPLYIKRKKEENEARLTEFEERAAIMEYDGGLPRAEAERQAKADIDTRKEMMK